MEKNFPDRTDACRAALEEAVEKVKESSELLDIPIPDLDDLRAVVRRMIDKLARKGADDEEDEEESSGQ